MAKPWDEYIRTAEKSIKGLERLIERLKTGFRAVKVETERETRGALRQWLEGTPKKARESTNAFLMISGLASVQPAFDAIDKAFQKITRMGQTQPLTAPTVLPPEEIQNIYGSNALMREETMFMLDDLEVPQPTLEEQNMILVGVVGDNKLNIGGIITRDGRRIKEEMQRAVTSEQPVATIDQQITDWQINQSFYDSSTLSHPRASVRGLMSRAAEQATGTGALGYRRMEDQAWTVLPTSDSVRVLDLLAFRLFTTKELDALMKKHSDGMQINSDWRGLGLGFNTQEYYIPLHKEQEEDAQEWSKAKRKGLTSKG